MSIKTQPHREAYNWEPPREDPDNKSRNDGINPKDVPLEQVHDVRASGHAQEDVIQNHMETICNAKPPIDPQPASKRGIPMNGNSCNDDVPEENPGHQKRGSGAKIDGFDNSENIPPKKTPNAKTLKIPCKTSSGKSHVVRVNPDGTVKEGVEEIYRQTGEPRSNGLFCNGQMLNQIPQDQNMGLAIGAFAVPMLASTLVLPAALSFGGKLIEGVKKTPAAAFGALAAIPTVQMVSQSYGG